MKVKELKRVENPNEFLKSWAGDTARRARKAGLRVGEVEVEQRAPNVFNVYVEHNGGGDLDWPAHKNVAPVKTGWKDGWYDWDADVYVKPYAFALVEVVAA